MTSDVFFFLGVFVFIFAVWVATGGPDRPISFAGPYITPITDVGQTQQGYGSFNFTSGFKPSATQSSQRSLNDANAQLAQLQKQARTQQLFGTPSPYANQVTIRNGNLAATDPDQEYFQLTYAGNAKQDIDISGWEIVSVATGHSATIPKGVQLLSLTGNSIRSDIVLHPGDQVLVATGASPIDVSFAENECSGYIQRQQAFLPPLSSSCPLATDDFNRLYTGNDANTLACKNALKNNPRCVVPTNESAIPDLCVSFVYSTLTYDGCVAHHQADQNFWSRRWRVFLDFDERDVHKRQDLWEPKNDVLKLLDAQGYTVASYSY